MVMEKKEERRQQQKKKKKNRAFLDYMQLLMLKVVSCNTNQNQLTRAPSFYRIRWQEGHFRDLAVNENSFLAEYRMPPSAFDFLHHLLEPILNVNQDMAYRSTASSGSDCISTASRLGAALILLGGGRVIEAMRTHGLAKATAYENFRNVVRRINSCESLKITCDNSIESLKERALGFERKSASKLFKYATGAIDGIAIRIHCPKNNKHQTKYYSGNKKFYCFNMQGVCDSTCAFIAVTCKHTGSTNDGDAFKYSSLMPFCTAQAFPYHWLGDNAYPLMESLLIPYNGINLHVICPEKESFNYWHSQLRITIERCFGIFVRRWGILWKALQFEFSFIPEIIHCLARLHNLLIKLNCPLPSQVAIADIANVDENGVLEENHYWHTLIPDENDVESGSELDMDLTTDSEEDDENYLRFGGSTLREELLEKVKMDSVNIGEGTLRRVRSHHGRFAAIQHNHQHN